MEKIIELIAKIIEKTYKQGKWVSLFSKTLNNNGTFFSHIDILDIAKSVYDCKGIDLEQTIQDSIKKILVQKGYSEAISNEDIINFARELIIAIKEENKEFYETYLIQDTNELVREVHRVVIPNQDFFVAPAVIEEGLTKNSNENIRLTLDYYDLDDFYIEKELLKKLQNKENIFIKYYEVEEAFYRILNYLVSNNYQNIKVVTNIDDWSAFLASGVFDSIVIPFFSFSSLELAKNNINIIITDGINYHENENSFLSLRKRTRENIYEHLVKVGLSQDEAWEYINETSGLFVPLQKKLLINYFVFDDGYHIDPNDLDAVLDLFLINKWCVGDVNLIESEFDIKDAESVFKKYSLGKNPVFIRVHNNYGKEVYSIAYQKEAQYEFFDKISKKKKKRFIDFAFNVLIQQSDRTDICTGITKSMVYVHYYSDCEIKDLIREKFISFTASIQKSSDLSCYSRYLNNFDDIVPDLFFALYKRLFEKEPKDFSNLITHYDYSLYFSLQRLIQKQEFGRETIFLVADMYQYNELVGDLLNNIFCAWYNFLPNSLKEQKVGLAREIIKRNEKMWLIIENNLPANNSIVGTNWPEPFIVDEEIQNRVDNKYIFDVSCGYMDICLDEMHSNIKRITEVLNKVLMFGNEYTDKFISKIKRLIKSFNDNDKAKLYYELRRFIYKNRFYKFSNWAITDERLDKIVKLLDYFKYSSPEYGYIYLYKNVFDNVLLNPIMRNA